MMLIAKHAKVFSRTGTLPFFLGCRFWLDFGPYTPGAREQFLAHRYPHDMLVAVSYA